MTIPLQAGVVYGPLESRRFGRSLGINLLSADAKACHFDCVYCQYGHTRKGGTSFPALSEIERDVRAAFSSASQKAAGIDWIMIAGNGEPTMHPYFAEAAELLAALRDEYLSGVPLGILSNSATVHRPSVREALMRLDGRFMKLDAGGERTLQAINRPLAGKVGWDGIVEGLRRLPKITLQSMFVTGSSDNTSDEALGEWVRAVGDISPADAQIYTVERPTACAGVLPVPKSKLERIAEILTRETGVRSLVYA